MGQKSSWLEDKLSDNAVGILVGVLLVAMGASGLVAWVYVSHFEGQPLKIDPEPWGQLGDYFGGILNPILGFLSVFALLVSLVIQSRELRLSREALKVSQEEQAKASAALDAQNSAIQHQSFEQTFFSWLGTYREQLASVEVVFKINAGKSQKDNMTTEQIRQERKGKRALHRWWQTDLSGEVLWNKLFFKLGSVAVDVMTQYGDDARACLTGLPPGAKHTAAREALDAWEELYRSWEYQLDSLFRTLYRLLQWIDSQAPERLTNAQKWLYVSIVRSQLSWIELVFLFYNGHTHRGMNFKAIAEKYALFDNLTFTSDGAIAVLREFPPGGLGYSRNAYESRLARVAMGLPEEGEEAIKAAAKGPVSVPAEAV